MKIAEIFFSVQGEGTLAGVPSVFIRTSGPARRPTWCDTPLNAWKPDGLDVGFGPILSNVRRHWSSYAVITGREPLLEDEIDVLAEKLRGIEHHVTIETSGAAYRELSCDLLSITPDLGEDLPIDTIKALIQRNNYQLKFLIETQDDIGRIRDFVTAVEADPKKVLVMPELTRSDIYMDRSRWLVSVCKNFNFRFCPRLQITSQADSRN